MSMTDPIADLLTRIRNGSTARKNAVDVPASNVKREVVRILKENSYVNDCIDLPDNKQGILRVYLRYSRDDEPVIRGIQRISRPGLRRYMNADEVRQTSRRHRGMIIMSTSSGLMTNIQAAEKGIGGEALVRCW